MDTRIAPSSINRRSPRWTLTPLVALLMIAGACSGTTGQLAGTDGGNIQIGNADVADGAGQQPAGGDAATAGGIAAGDTADEGRPVVVGADAGVDAATVAASVAELPPAGEGFPEIRVERAPVGLSIPALGIDIAAPVVAVGVETNGDMEVPPADEVGWYQFGPSPGQQGSSVLAAHIAYDGEDGVFIDLADLADGSLITVDYDDGTTADFLAVDKAQYTKAELPRDRIFGREGEPSLVLITCGGHFNRQIRSYDDNVVVYALPV